MTGETAAFRLNMNYNNVLDKSLARALFLLYNPAKFEDLCVTKRLFM